MSSTEQDLHAFAPGVRSVREHFLDSQPYRNYMAWVPVAKDKCPILPDEVPVVLIWVEEEDCKTNVRLILERRMTCRAKLPGTYALHDQLAEVLQLDLCDGFCERHTHGYLVWLD